MISIVVPIYKSEKTLGGCLESLLAQTYKDIEVICVIDGSPDRCGEICDSYAEKDGRIKVIKRENGGVSSARNRGIDEASGEYVMFVDSDDTVEPDYCEKMWNAYERTGAELVICGFHHWYVGRDVEKTPSNAGVYDTKNYGADFLKLYQEGFLNMPWNKLFQKKLTGRFDTTLSLGEDLLFNMDYLENCSKVAVISDALINYIQEEKGNTLSSKKRDNKLEIASRVCSRVQAYYGKLTGEKKLHPVIAGKFVMEFLDDCERLPFDKETSKTEKLQLIGKLADYKEFMDANKIAEVTVLDYKVLQWCFAHGMWRLVYPICVLRKGVVVAARWIWNR
ncbi:MAG: glycosyltransferase family 2 protein [Lachnospiraceae bacterium]|nr:glycosyltransferase family 2 protein [Lachnospiraceae bacterium]